MKIELGIGGRTHPLLLPDENVQAVLLPKQIEHTRTGAEVVFRALRVPIGAPPLREVVNPGERVCIIASDITRPCPSWLILPVVLDELSAAGVADSDITVVFALGSHRGHTEAEMRHLTGDAVFERIHCVDSDPNDCVHLVVTSWGTPVDITRIVAKADRRICLGNIEYHYFAGYSGGAKAIMPGVSTRSAIQANHSMMVRPGAHAGKICGNPIREDIEEAAAICGIDYIVNVILDEHKQIIHAVAGEATLAHREGCQFLDQLYRRRISKRADIVVVSQGGAPKDLNLYQTQKALDNAKHAVRKGGIIVLVGSCREGLGEQTFEEWMLHAEKPEDLIQRIQRKFELGGHKAAAIAMVLEDADVYLVSDLKPEAVEQLFMKPFSTVQAAVDAAMGKLGPSASVIVMPYGGSTLPVE